MQKPTNADMARLKRIARYLYLHPRAVFKYPHQYFPSSLTVYSDSNWANCLRTRKSTQGGATMFGSHCTKSWASTQAIISLSSGEAEYYGVVKATSVALGMQAMLQDMGISPTIHVYTDAEAARGIATRRGLGRTRHIEVHYLWVL